MSNPPVGFERATGRVEGRRLCRACGRLYPVTQHDLQAACPYCHSTNTREVTAAGSTRLPPMSNTPDGPA